MVRLIMTQFTNEKTAVDRHAFYEPPRAIQMDSTMDDIGCFPGLKQVSLCRVGVTGAHV